VARTHDTLDRDGNVSLLYVIVISVASTKALAAQKRIVTPTAVTNMAAPEKTPPLQDARARGIRPIDKELSSRRLGLVAGFLIAGFIDRPGGFRRYG